MTDVTTFRRFVFLALDSSETNVWECIYSPDEVPIEQITINDGRGEPHSMSVETARGLSAILAAALARHDYEAKYGEVIGYEGSESGKPEEVRDE